MKNTLAILLVLLFITNNSFGQQMNREKIKTLKTAYITEALNLKPKEAEKFWPIYNMYSENIQKNKMQLESGLQRELNFDGGIENLSDEDAKKLIQKSIQFEKQIAEDKIKLIEELSKIISNKKIIRLKIAEKQFNKRILQEYGKRRRMGQN
jgi:hypothetical protein